MYDNTLCEIMLNKEKCCCEGEGEKCRFVKGLGNVIVTWGGDMNCRSSG